MTLLSKRKTTTAHEEVPALAVSAPVSPVAEANAAIEAFKAGLQQMAADIAAKEDSYTLSPSVTLLDEIMRLAKQLELEARRLPLLEQRLRDAKADEQVEAHAERLKVLISQIDELSALIVDEKRKALRAELRALDDREMHLRRVVNFGQRELHSPITALYQSGQRDLAQAVSARTQALDANVREKLDRAFGERGPWSLK